MIYPMKSAPRQPVSITPAGTQSGVTPAGAQSGGMLSMPEFNFTSTIDNGNKGDYLANYYGQMANTYLPQVDSFAQQNAGKMVDWSPDSYMTVEDFGFGAGRGDLRGDVPTGYYVGDKFEDTWTTPGAIGTEGETLPDAAKYYVKNGEGYEAYTGPSDPYAEYVQTVEPLNNGAELFSRREDGTALDGSPNYVYVSSGTYRGETSTEAFTRLAEAGGTANPDADFGGSSILPHLLTDKGGKWGADPVNMPELAPYLDNPDWVQRDDKGEITGIRAELLPLVFREQIGLELRSITRGGSEKATSAFGIFTKAIIAYAFGAGAGAFVGQAAAGSSLSASTTSTLSSAVSGGVNGGVGAAMNGGDVWKGVLLGTVGGGLSPTVSSGLDSLGIAKGGLLNKAVTGGFVGGTKAAISGTDILNGTLVGAGTNTIMGGLKEFGVAGDNPLIDNVLSTFIGKGLNLALNDGTTEPATSVKSKPADDQPAKDKPAKDKTINKRPIGRINYRP